MLEEDAELGVGVGVDGGLEDGQEDVLQHLTEVGNKVLGSEDVTEGDSGRNEERRSESARNQYMAQHESIKSHK